MIAQMSKFPGERYGKRQWAKTRRAATSELEDDEEKKVRHEVTAAVIGIMFKVIFGITHLSSGQLILYTTAIVMKSQILN